MSNAKIKLIRKLSMKKYRAETGLFVAEGLRLCEMALNHAEIEFGLYTKTFLKTARHVELLTALEKLTTLIEISPAEFEKLSDTETPQGILLAVHQKLSPIDEVAKKFLIVALDGVKDPGNVGTILRTAEAFGCGVAMLDDAADIFNSKVVRSSMGAIFTLPIAKLSRENFLASMKKFGVEVTATVLDDTAEKYFCHDFTKKSAVVFGSEADGVSAEIFNSTKKIFIPMIGTAESLNVATAAGIIIAESVRQTDCRL